MSGSGLDDMLSLVRQIAEQAKHDQQRSLKAKREQMVRQAAAAVSNREAELAEQLAKKEDEYFNELQTLMEGLNEEVVALLAGGDEDEVACKPSKDKEVKRAGDAVLEALGEFIWRLVGAFRVFGT